MSPGDGEPRSAPQRRSRLDGLALAAGAAGVAAALAGWPAPRAVLGAVAGLLLLRGLRGLAFAAPGGEAARDDEALRRELEETNARLAGRAGTLQRILEVSNELKSHLTLDQVLGNIVRAVAKSFGARAVLLSLHDRTEGVLERRAQVGLDDVWPELRERKVPLSDISPFLVERHRISKSYFVSRLERSGPIFVPGSAGRHRRGTLPWSDRPEDMLLVPLTSGETLVGLLQVDEGRGKGPPPVDEVQALEVFANQAVTAIQSARAWEVTRLTTVRDSLTSAWNHRHFQETLTREVKRHERSGLPLALLMIDLDDFKGVNDRYGHPAGDAVLKGIVDEIVASVREVDTVARYGGEEFAVVLPETTAENALLVAGRIRAAVEARTFEVRGLPEPLRVTISTGLACYPEDALTKRDLIACADQALYEAKRSGKNRVIAIDGSRRRPSRAHAGA